jgi:predicted Rossmann fold flavoprotein
LDFAMTERRVVIIGGGAAGFFAAIVCAESSPTTRVILFERSSQFLTKVRISGGGRCNVTHACFDARDLSANYPRGGSALLGPFSRFQPSDTIAWFEGRGVPLKTEKDGRIFPVSDSSQTIVDSLLNAARSAGVELVSNRGLDRVTRSGDQFELTLTNGERCSCDRLMLATGGCRSLAAGQFAVSLGHSIVPPVPSLFTFQTAAPWLTELAGISVESVEATVAGQRLRERGALLITHQGLSGPVILRLSAWGARVLHGLGYRFPLRLNWLPHFDAETIRERLDARRASHSARLVANDSILALPARLWERIVLQSGIPRETRWPALSRAAQHRLVQQLGSTELGVVGKSLNKDEFVTCGGVCLNEVNFRTMESRICPGLYFGGEFLDVDGLTGGFNFQAAWTTGWIAGQSLSC